MEQLAVAIYENTNFRFTSEDFRVGSHIAAFTLILTALLELTSLPTVRGVLSQSGGPRLYATALALNVINLLIGIPMYALSVAMFCNLEPIGWVRVYRPSSAHSQFIRCATGSSTA